MPAEEITDKELHRLCLIALSKGWAREHFYESLKADRKKVGQLRVYRVWKEHNGPVQYHRRK